MAKYQLQVDIVGSKLIIEFDSLEELEQRLRTLDFKVLEGILSLHLKTVMKGEPRKVKPALNGICSFRMDGTLEFLKPAESKLETIALILYAFDPDPVDSQTIGTLAAAKNPAAYLGHKNYTKLFQKIGLGVYGLSHEGKKWVATEIIPKLSKES